MRSSALPVRREEESILLPADPRLRCNDMGKPRYRNRDLLDFKCPARRPDGFEIEPAHHARQIHVGPHPVAGTCERASLDHRAGQRGIARFIKRFRPGEQLESAAPAHTPRNEQVPGVRGQEEIAIERHQHRTAGRRIVVRAPHADDHVPYALRREGAGKRSEPIHGLSAASPNSGGVPRRRERDEPSSCRHRTRCRESLRDERCAGGSQVRVSTRMGNRSPDSPESSCPLPNVQPLLPCRLHPRYAARETV